MTAPAETPPRRLSIATYLGIGLGGLVAAALALLLWVTLSAVFKNTTELLNDKSRLFLGALSSQTRQYLDATLAPSAVAAAEIASGQVDPRDDRQIMPLLRTLLAAAPQITAMAFFDVDRTSVAAYREGGEVLAVRQPWPDNEDFEAVLNRIRSGRALVWGPPVYNPDIGTFINLRRAVFREGDFRGMIAAVINLQALSTFLDGLKTEIGQNAFILYDRDYVLAHPRLIEPFAGLSEDQPLPTVEEIGDPILAGIWREGWEQERLVAGSGHADDSGDRDYIFLYEPLDDYADAAWLIGSYFPEDTVATQFERMIASGVLSLIIMVAAIAATYLLGRLLRQPIGELAEAASLVRGLDFDRVPTIGPSRFAELDNAGRAFNGMVAALRTFSLYVPRTLVSRLIETGDAEAIRSEVRPVTIMMSDIVGFTSRAERMAAEETAAFLNSHLALVTGCVEAEGGVVDKFMGDGVMAHWGALDQEPDHAGRAVRAALRIRSAQMDANRGVADPIRVRIGIHSGPVVAGNLGTATRMNYTVVGDTVNMAQRLEALGKTLAPANEIAILMSAETKEALDPGIETRSLGRHELRGREATSEVFTVKD